MVLASIRVLSKWRKLIACAARSLEMEDYLFMNTQLLLLFNKYGMSAGACVSPNRALLGLDFMITYLHTDEFLSVSEKYMYNIIIAVTIRKYLFATASLSLSLSLSD